MATLKISTDLLNLIHPVGSIYMSTNSTSPATLFGGTWSQITGRFLWATGSTPMQTGGSQTSSISIAVGNLPSHNHSIPALSGYTSWNGAHSHTGKIHTKTDGHNSGNIPDARGWSSATSGNIQELQITNQVDNHQHTVATYASTSGDTGSGTAISFSIMPPYYEVYMWRRTA